MSVRPYPSRDRALRQILRRHPRDTPPLPGPRTAGEQPGLYVLSMRRPGAVSGPS
ncbi:hypothetical protein [Streptomyces sp. TRM75561]|uniref:hypothetical protein n=1 Tax=Streptomyces sp. TRM75561 TaxID=2975269 RepID=UPI00244A873E|nr:hypothetical protein [Streptomyces sp. TRM75561]MDH3037950.1 hypothetical protein [Streptomyces sp. TRM75561]